MFFLEFYVINTVDNLSFQPYYSIPQSTCHQLSENAHHMGCAIQTSVPINSREPCGTRIARKFFVVTACTFLADFSK